MPDLSLATGVDLLYDEGILPPNPARQALAFASLAQNEKLGSDGLAFQRTATVMAMEEEKPAATVEFSSEAMQFLVDDLASPESSTLKSQASAPSGSGYPYGGWSAVSSESISPQLAASAADSSPSINLFA